MPADPAAVPRARRHVRQVLSEAGLDDLVEAVELVVSEIVTNAVTACSANVRSELAGVAAVRLWVASDLEGVLVQVWDPDPSKPQLRRAGPDAESGRGLLLVEALSVAWGSFELVDDQGKVVWALCQS